MPSHSIIEFELLNLEKELRIVKIITDRKTAKNFDEIDIRAAALSMAALYNGMEKVLIQLLILKKIETKESSTWHSNLLRLAKDSDIISEKVFIDLKGFMSFRHFVRHAYSFEIDPLTIKAVIEKAPNLVKSFCCEVNDYLTRL